MSKAIFPNGVGTGSFLEVLGTAVPPPPQHKTKGLRPSLQLIQDEAREEGYREGLQLGRANGEQAWIEQFGAAYEQQYAAHLDAFAQALERVVEQSESAIDEWYRQAEESLATLAVEIARRAICQELGQDRGSVVEIARAALAEVRHGTSVRLRVNPVDLAALEPRLKQVATAASSVRSVELVADGSIAAGCIVDTDGGIVDGRVAAYLFRLAQEAL